jgi:ABC-type multidrug transport system fused ATPase/permease subunit
MLVMKLAPQLAAGRWLNAALVERPLEKIAVMDRRQVIMLMILLGLTLFAADMVMMFGSYDLLTLYAWDLTVYLDTMMVAYALVAVARGRAAVRWVALRGSLLLRQGARSRARRTRAVAAKTQDGADNDDDPAPAWSLTA